MHHPLVLKDDKDVFDFVLKPLIRKSPSAIGKDINYEYLDESPILNHKVINLFCE